MMAADWIKMRVDLATDPAVISIAAATGLDEDAVVGKLHRLWSWADQQTTNGNAAGVTKNWIDRFLRAENFANAMENAGWLTVKNDGVRFPRFDRHNGQSGKRRALTAKRVAKCKAQKGNAKGNARSVSDALPREEESKSNNTPLSPPKGKRGSRQRFTPPTVDEVAAYCHERTNGIDPAAFWNHYEANGWKRGSTRITDWKACVRTWEARRQKENPPAESRVATAEDLENFDLVNGAVR